MATTPTVPIVMYLAIGRRCPRGAYFNLPHKDEPMTAKMIIKKYPQFASIFDGDCLENTLLFYYKRNKATDVYEFIDEDSEAEVADLLGVKVKTFHDDAEEEEDGIGQAPLNEKQVASFKEHMQDIRQGIDWINNS